MARSDSQASTQHDGDVIRLMEGQVRLSADAGTNQHEPQGFIRLAFKVYPLKRRDPSRSYSEGETLLASRFSGRQRAGSTSV